MPRFIARSATADVMSDSDCAEGIRVRFGDGIHGALPSRAAKIDATFRMDDALSKSALRRATAAPTADDALCGAIRSSPKVTP
jgi:hypothetical protein